MQGKGAISFVLRPDGEAVAYQMLGRDDDDLFDRRATQPGDGVRVVDVRTGVDAARHLDPRDDVLVEPRRRATAHARARARGAGHDPVPVAGLERGRASEVAGRHSPTIEVLRDYAPFFTQYAQSTTPWAPDGSAFAFPSEGPDGAGQIVVQEVGGDPVVIGPGVFVTWSPS